MAVDGDARRPRRGQSASVATATPHFCKYYSTPTATAAALPHLNLYTGLYTHASEERAEERESDDPVPSWPGCAYEHAHLWAAPGLDAKAAPPPASQRQRLSPRREAGGAERHRRAPDRPR